MRNKRISYWNIGLHHGRIIVCVGDGIDEVGQGFPWVLMSVPGRIQRGSVEGLRRTGPVVIEAVVVESIQGHRGGSRHGTPTSSRKNG